MEKKMLDFLTRLSHGLAAQFGENCEIVIHDINHNKDMPSTIVSIDNGHVTGRKIGDGPSQMKISFRTVSRILQKPWTVKFFAHQQYI